MENETQVIARKEPETKNEGVTPILEVPKETFAEANLDRAVSRIVDKNLIPPLSGVAKIAVVGLASLTAVAAATGVVSFVRVALEQPLLFLIPVSAAAMFLASGYDNWRTNRHNNSQENQ